MRVTFNLVDGRSYQINNFTTKYIMDLVEDLKEEVGFLGLSSNDQDMTYINKAAITSVDVEYTDS